MGFLDDPSLKEVNELSRTPRPPPLDDNLVAWTQVIAGHLLAFNCWGFINSFGLFQAYYTSTLGEGPSAVSWVGSIQTFLTLFTGTFSGRAMDAGYYRYVAWSGLFLQLFGVFMTSVTTQYWQFLLTQGVCQGLGNGLVFSPTMALVSTYFTRNKALAIAGMSSGTATGGVVFPIIARQLLDQVGFAWTIRVMGFVMLANAAFILSVARTKTPPRRTGPLVEFAAFKDTWFSLFGLGLFLVVLGLYFVYYYITTFAEDTMHASSATSLDLLLAVNAMGLPGRLMPAWISDRYIGPLNTLIITAGCSGVLVFAWAAVASLNGTWAFAIAYGFVAANVQSLVPPAIAAYESDKTKSGVLIGMMFSITSIACLCGPPISGALIERNEGSYLYAQMFGGSIMICGALVLLVPRVLTFGWYPLVRA